MAFNPRLHFIFNTTNSVGSDSHLQFMNWTVDNNGAYDYAADTRGYTVGAIVDYENRKWGVRFAEALMPKVANGIDLDWNLRRARVENLEFQVQPVLWREHKTTLRLLYRVASRCYQPPRPRQSEERAHFLDGASTP